VSLDLSPWARRGIADPEPFYALALGGRLFMTRRGPQGDFQATWIVGGALRGAARDPDPMAAAVRAIGGGGDPQSAASADAVTGTE